MKGRARVQQSRFGLSMLLRHGAVALGVSLAAKAAAAALLVVQMLLLARIVSALAFDGASIAGQQSQLSWLVVAFLSRSGLQLIADLAGEFAGLRSTAWLRRRLFAHLQRVGPVGLAQRPVGALAALLTDGVNALQPFVAQYIPRAAAMLVLPLIILGVVARLDFWSLVILAVTGPLIPLFMVLVGYGAQSRMQRQWARLLRLGGAFLDYLQGLTSLRLLGRAQDSVVLLGRAADQHREASLQVMRVAFLTSAALEFFATLAIALVAVTLGARLLAGTLEFRVAFAVLLLVPEFFAPLREFSASYHARQNAQAAMEKIAELMGLSQLRQPYRPVVDPAGGLDRIELDELSAGYPGGPAVLRRLCGVFHSGRLNVISGASGAGKTTLARLLAGLMPVAGGALRGADQAGRVLPREQWRSALVTQNPQLLDGSIADNLRLNAPQASEAQLLAAMDACACRAFIQGFPQGLQTRVGESGAALSSGEIRRIALIRAVLGDPQLLVLDEPTANLDPQSAAAVVTSIKALSRGRLVLAISHRCDVIEQAEALFTLTHGRLQVNRGEVAA